MTGTGLGHRDVALGHRLWSWRGAGVPSEGPGIATKPCQQTAFGHVQLKAVVRRGGDNEPVGIISCEVGCRLESPIGFSDIHGCHHGPESKF